ncbi:hypothetical protein GF377_02240, partial [candidate division GN15 bacterium]|nr:hypothetical protein [candidate division GN15 bacterium]
MTQGTTTESAHRESATASKRWQQVIDLWRQHPAFLNLTNALQGPDRTELTVSGLVGSAEAILLRSLWEETGRPALVVTERPDEANDLYDDLSLLLGEDKVGHFPSRQILPYDFRSPVGEIMGRRISTLSGMLDNKLAVVVCPIRALLEPTMLVQSLKDHRIHLEKGAEVDPDDIVHSLVTLGFRRVPLVEEVGDFAVRGGLIDFFTPGAQAPVRVEFFGNEVDTIRTFDVASQRTVDRTELVNVLPKR